MVFTAESLLTMAIEILPRGSGRGDVQQRRDGGGGGRRNSIIAYNDLNALAADFVAMEFGDANPRFGFGGNDDGSGSHVTGGGRAQADVQDVDVLLEHGGNQLFPFLLADFSVQVVNGERHRVV